jgi:signal transduction histidine kinase
MSHEHVKNDESDVLEGLLSGSGPSVPAGLAKRADDLGPLASLLPPQFPEDGGSLDGEHPSSDRLVAGDGPEGISGSVPHVSAATGGDSAPYDSERQRILHRNQEEVNGRVAERTVELERINEELRRQFVELQREEKTLRHMVKASADIIQAIPCGLLLFQYQPPGELFFLSCNAEAKRLMALNSDDCRGSELAEIWPNAWRHGLTEAFLTAAQRDEPFETDRAYFCRGRIERILKVRAFSMPGNRLGVAFEDATDRIRVEQALQENRDRQEEPQHTVVTARAGEEQIPQEAVAPQQGLDERASGAIRTAVQEELAAAAARCLGPLVKTLEEAALRATSRVEAGYLSLVKASLTEIQVSVNEVAEIVKRLRQFSRVPPSAAALARRVVDLSDAVREGIELLLHSGAFRDESPVSVRPEDLELAEGCYVEGEWSELVDLVIALVENSVEAGLDRGRVVITTLHEHDEVVLEVRTEGVGMPEHLAATVFEPFWTSKASHAGLGLCAAAGIVRRYGGTLHLRLREDQQTAFVVRLPSAEKP